jgi:GntR family transcriptional regulator
LRVCNGSQTQFDTSSHICHITTVTLFGFTLQPGQSIFDQVVFSATKAFVSGQFQPGQPFPSVRALASELKIHPNTAHKVVQHLIQERWLEVQPGIGTVVAARPAARAGDRQRLLHHEVEQLVVEALRVGVKLDDVLDAIETRWAKLGTDARVTRREVSRR